MWRILKCCGSLSRIVSVQTDCFLTAYIAVTVVKTQFHPFNITGIRSMIKQQLKRGNDKRDIHDRNDFLSLENLPKISLSRKTYHNSLHCTLLYNRLLSMIRVLFSTPSELINFKWKDLTFIGRWWVIAISNVAFLENPWTKSSPLSPVTRTVWALSPVTFRFHRPAAGSFTLTMSAFLILSNSRNPLSLVKVTPNKR